MDGDRISRFAQRVGVAASTLRFYEQQGLLAGARTPAGYRVYTDGDADRVAFITTGKHLGLSLAQIRELLGVWDGGRCRDIRNELRLMIAAQITAADARVAQLRVFRARLAAAVEQLRELPARDGPCDPGYGFLHDRPAATAEPDRPAAPLPPGPVHSGPLPLVRDTDDPRPPHDRDVVLACSLDAAEYRDRARQWRTVLTGASPTPRSDAITVHLDVARAGELAALVAAEQRCCPSFTFTVVFTAGRVELTARAPHAARSLLDDLFTTDPTPNPTPEQAADPDGGAA